MKVLGAFLLCCLFALPALGVGASQNDSGDGSKRDSPLPFGETAKIEDYEIEVVSVDLDAADVIQAENQFNDPPEAGNVFVLVRVKVKYVGSETGDPGFALNFSTVGSENRGYSQSDRSCGSIPEGEFTAGELFEDGEAEYNLCWQVSEEEAPTLVLYAEPTFSIDSEPVFLSLEDTDDGTPEALGTPGTPGTPENVD